ncbi:MAG: hypothetical protein LBU92_04655 [Prevotellaceae bacterium]|jgi:hypothetical protein|nr:hypothetical protein [Prevotellaceae bacterium]
MVVISSSQLREKQRHYFQVATSERVVVKQGQLFFELLPCGATIFDNPSPSNDPYFENPYNVAAIEAGIAQIKAGKGSVLSKKEQQELLGL